jgi:hypothetical protein
MVNASSYALNSSRVDATEYAIFCSAEMETSSHHCNAMESSPALCYYMAKSTKRDSRPQSVTTNLLTRKLDITSDLNCQQQAVDAVLFTSGKL